MVGRRPQGLCSATVERGRQSNRLSRRRPSGAGPLSVAAGANPGSGTARRRKPRQDRRGRYRFLLSGPTARRTVACSGRPPLPIRGNVESLLGIDGTVPVTDTVSRRTARSGWLLRLRSAAAARRAPDPHGRPRGRCPRHASRHLLDVPLGELLEGLVGLHVDTPPSRAGRRARELPSSAWNASWPSPSVDLVSRWDRRQRHLHGLLTLDSADPNRSGPGEPL